ncbi:MAG: AraC family transcriptional regulator [Cyclobacteriaceae bacterium]|jgi:AraC-like DNA-binding protein|nr:AraC family transcriptional regulator [Cyclobacteriaceae bacterium]
MAFSSPAALFPSYSIGHFINQPANPTEFEISHFHAMEEPNVDDVHKHTFYEILWIEKGRSRQRIDYREYEVRPGSLFFISPGQVHEFEEWRPITGGTLMFTESFFLVNQANKDMLFELSFLDNFYANPVLTPTKKEFAELVHTLGQLTRERQRADYSPALARAWLHVLMLQIQRCIERQGARSSPARYTIIYKRFKELLDTHFLSQWAVSAYASELAITSHHLNEVCKRVTGRTATEVIRARCILEAKRLLTFGHASVSEVAAQIGYFDSSYFAKMFKAETGTTPVAFRETMSESYRRR